MGWARRASEQKLKLSKKMLHGFEKAEKGWRREAALNMLSQSDHSVTARTFSEWAGACKRDKEEREAAVQRLKLKKEAGERLIAAVSGGLRTADFCF